MEIDVIIKEAEQIIEPILKEADKTAYRLQERVSEVFRRHKVSERHFNGSYGYGYNDIGRDTLDLVYADIFEAESAVVRHNIISGTHALTIALFGLLRPEDTLLSVTGRPYDTLEAVIGGKSGDGSLADFGISYKQTEITDGTIFDYKKIEEELGTDKTIKVIFVQKSKGYSERISISSAVIGELVKFVKGINPDVYIMVDNCYGELTEEHEPTYYGADLAVGSLIKNAGGGIAECGGYFAGVRRAVELAAYRMTVPGIGGEAGASLNQSKNIYRGIFYAPHTVAQALKTAIYAAYIYGKLGFEVNPLYDEKRYDIIQTIKFNEMEKLLRFCRGIQAGSPIDSNVTPEAWEMPGYSHKVIMAAGTFIQGASIELSADAPIKPPYTAYLQGGLTYESGKIGINHSIKEIIK